jgi:DNA-binding NarL/FixJ family response regulator
MLTIPIVVNVDVPAYRDGLVATFGAAGFPTEEPDHLETWAAQEGLRGLLTSVTDAEDHEALARLRTLGDNLVILALLPEPTCQGYREALRYGASVAVAWDSSVEAILQAFHAALSGQCMLPLAVSQALLGGRPDSGTTVFEERWLRMIAAGCSTDDVANDAGYPERDMLRILHDLYERLGLSTQTDVVLTVGHWLTRGRGEDAPPSA